MSAGERSTSETGAVRAHAAGVRTRDRRRAGACDPAPAGSAIDALAVGEREERQLLALHELLDEHRVARVAERVLARASTRRRVCASSTVAQMITPLPAASPDALTTTGAPSSAIARFASSSDVAGDRRAPSARRRRP